MQLHENTDTHSKYPLDVLLLLKLDPLLLGGSSIQPTVLIHSLICVTLRFLGAFLIFFFFSCSHDNKQEKKGNIKVSFLFRARISA